MTTKPMTACQTQPSTNTGVGSTGLRIAERQSDCLPDPAILTPEERSREFARIMFRAIQRRHAGQAH